MAYYTREELEKMNFKYLGKDVMISTLARIYNPEKTIINDYSRIDDFCVFTGDVTIGKHVHIGLYVHLGGGKLNKIVFEDYTGAAFHTVVITHSDDYSLERMTNPTVPMEYRGGDAGDVIVKKFALLGSNSLVMPNVTVGEGATTGAFTFVNRNLDPWGLYVGQPAKRIRENSQNCKALAEKLEKAENEKH